MTEEQEKIIHIASRQGDMCVHLAAVVCDVATAMIKYCDDNDIRIDPFERKQWNMLIKSSKYLDTLVLSQNREGINRFRRNVKMIGMLIRLTLARVDDDDMKLYQWYNYIKNFPTDLPEVQPTAEEESEAFKHIFQ